MTGEVPDVRPHVGEAGVSVAPFRLARGLQTKIIESMALAVPVVGTTISFQGIPTGENCGVFYADDPQAFADAVVTMLTDDDPRRQAAREARRYVEEHHRWDDMNSKLEALLIDDLAPAKA